jgi:hypothetical protein
VCRSVFYIQSMPVAASTFSLMMLSLDRLVFFYVREIAFLCARLSLSKFLKTFFPPSVSSDLQLSACGHNS